MAISFICYILVYIYFLCVPSMWGLEDRPILPCPPSPPKGAAARHTDLFVSIFMKLSFTNCDLVNWLWRCMFMLKSSLIFTNYVYLVGMLLILVMSSNGSTTHQLACIHLMLFKLASKQLIIIYFNVAYSIYKMVLVASLTLWFFPLCLHLIILLHSSELPYMRLVKFPS